MVDGHRRQNQKASKQKMSFISTTTTVCCMCGDVGFPDKIFRCSRCTSRFQHSYCSNYYNSQCPIEICDWCRYEESSNNSSPSSSSKLQATHHGSGRNSTDQHHRLLQLNSRSEYSSRDRLKQHEHREDQKGTTNNKQGGVPSPRTATKRYKLLKDVMC